MWPKTELIRLVNIGVKVELDLSGSKPGRGTYVCPVDSCWKASLKGDRLSNALRIKVSAEDKNRISECFKRVNMKVD